MALFLLLHSVLLLSMSLSPGKDALRKFLALCIPEAEIANVPWMLDSSKFDVVCEGLKLLPGKSIVNSISLKVGEEEFIRHAKHIRRFGCAVVVMAFDEVGQAVSCAEKVRICERSYKILVEKCDFAPEDIIFDCNILTIATGLEEHNAYGIDFIKAVEELSEKLPGASYSGGLSNLSFSFRGLGEIREAMHAVFLYHAIPKGLNMSIVNAGALPIYTDIETELRELCEEVILNVSEDGNHVERFLKKAEAVKDRIAAEKVGIVEVAKERWGWGWGGKRVELPVLVKLFYWEPIFASFVFLATRETFLDGNNVRLGGMISLVVGSGFCL